MYNTINSGTPYKSHPEFMKSVKMFTVPRFCSFFCVNSIFRSFVDLAFFDFTYVQLYFQFYFKGIIKPDIVFFGEDLPKKFFEYPKHFTKCDLLIVLGTSLEVYPFAGLVDEVSRSTPRILINRDIVGPFVRRKKRPNDVVVKGDIVESVRHLVQLLGWTESIEFLMKKEGFDTAIPRSRNPEVDGEIVIHGKEDEGETGKKL